MKTLVLLLGLLIVLFLGCASVNEPLKLWDSHKIINNFYNGENK